MCNSGPTHLSMHLLKHMLSLGWPFIIAVLLGYVLLHGMVDFGGGEKDLVFIIPSMAFALSYMIIYLILVRKVSLLRTVLYSTCISLGLLILFILSFPGITGIDW